MSYYELFQQEPSAYIPILFLSLIITVAAYGAFPIFFAKVRKTNITKRKYRAFCYGINAAVLFLFVIINGNASNGGAYLLWTWIFSRWGIKILDANGNFTEIVHTTCTSNAMDNNDVHNVAINKNPPTETSEQLINDPLVKNYVREAQTNIPTKTKIRFCSKCGLLIDNDTKKCTGCGKQYFKGIRVNPAYILFTLIVLALVFALLSSLSKIAVMKQEINNKNTTISELSLDIQKMNEEINTQYEEGKTIGYNEGYSEGFAEGSIKAAAQDPSIICSHTYMVFHNMDCYCGWAHHLRCKYNTNDEQYLYLTLSEALQLGYKPCEECY